MIWALGKSLALQVAQSCYPGRIFVRALREIRSGGARKYFGRSQWSKSAPRVHTSDASFTLDCPNRVMVHFILGKNWNQLSWRSGCRAGHRISDSAQLNASKDVRISTPQLPDQIRKDVHLWRRTL